MAFLWGFLVFLAGIMTYILFPRSDQIQVQVFQEEANVVTFLNQHQAAKDYMYQMTTWHEAPANSTFMPYSFPNTDIEALLARPMKDGGLHDIAESNTNVPEEGSFASSIVCLDATGNMAACPTMGTGSAQYVMTYGYVPDWWSDNTKRKELWLKAMLKRSHGSSHCGRLEEVCDGAHYSINNGQRYTGFEDSNCLDGNTYQIIPDAVAAWLDAHLSSDADVENPDILLCMSPVKDPYEGRPVFLWDSINNTGKGHTMTGLEVAPLVGVLDSNIIKKSEVLGFTGRTYNIIGVVKGDRSRSNFVILDNNDTVIQEDTSSNTLSVGSVSVADIPANTPYVFSYSSTNSSQQLNVYYYETKKGNGEYSVSLRTLSSGMEPTAGPALQNLRTGVPLSELGGTQPLLALRIYENTLPTKELLHNLQVDRKRFGL